jgi:hypothetical protein
MYNNDDFSDCTPPRPSASNTVFSRFFGQYLIMYCLKNSSDAALRELVPEGYEDWCKFVVGQLKKGAPHSPVVANDAQVVDTISGRV